MGPVLGKRYFAVVMGRSKGLVEVRSRVRWLVRAGSQVPGNDVLLLCFSNAAGGSDAGF